MSNNKDYPACSLLRTFESLFQGQKYYHRNSALGDSVAIRIFEDLFVLNRSTKLQKWISAQEHVVNAKNLATGKKSRRGDGTFGELIPHTIALKPEGCYVARGPIANIEIGVETKILAKSMIKQIDRVISDLVRQVSEFKKTGGNPICIGIVGINFASHYIGYEGERAYPTNGKNHKHPRQEAPEAENRLLQSAKPAFDEFQILRFCATNEEPFPFSWVDFDNTANEYLAMLVRISREYDRRF